jgi:hypothetical protein
MPGACQGTRVVKKLASDQPGALKLARRFGGALVCVRYRQGAPGQRRYTTVKLVVDEAPVNSRRSNEELVAVRIGFNDAELRRRIISHGATWDPKTRLWRMPRGTAKLLHLSSRVIAE